MKTKLHFFSLTLLIFQGLLCPGQGVWTPKENYPDTAYKSVAFAIGSKGYIGLGQQDSTRCFWEYDPASDNWTPIADFPGPARTRSVAFSIGTKGYVTSGSCPGGHCRDLWEYDQLTNAWTRKADPPFNSRTYATGFSIGNRGYVGTGDSTYLGISIDYVRDFWEYDPSSDTWVQIPDFPSVGRAPAVGFSIGNKGYVGTGNQEITDMPTQDFWEYDPVSQEWTPKADLPTAKCGATGFAIGSKGYIGTGVTGHTTLTRDFYEYDPDADSWTQVSDLPGPARKHGIGFAIGAKGYVGNGGYDDLWEFDPAAVSVTENTSNSGVTVYPNPGSGIFTAEGATPFRITIYNVLGGIISEERSEGTRRSLDLSGFPQGVYWYSVESEDRSCSNESW